MTISTIGLTDYLFLMQVATILSYSWIMLVVTIWLFKQRATRSVISKSLFGLTCALALSKCSHLRRDLTVRALRLLKALAIILSAVPRLRVGKIAFDEFSSKKAAMSRGFLYLNPVCTFVLAFSLDLSPKPTSFLSVKSIWVKTGHEVSGKVQPNPEASR